MGETISSIKYLTISRGIELGLAFFLNVILFRTLSTEGMGIYALIISFVAIAQTLSDVGLGEATMYYLAKNAHNQKQAKKVFATGFLSIGVLALMFALGLIVVSPVLARIYSINVLYFILCGVMLCAVVVKVGLDQALEAHKHFKARSLSGIVFTASRFSSVLFVILGLGTFGAISGEVVGQLVSIMLAFFVLKKLFSAQFSWSVLRTLFLYGRKIVMGTFFNLIQAHGVVLILGYFTLSGNGIFGALAKFTILVTSFSDSVLKVLYPRIVELRKQPIELLSQFNIFFKYNLILPIFLGGMSIIFAKPFLHVVYGNKIVGSELVFAVIMLSAIVDAVSILFHKLLTGMARPELLSKSIAIKAVVILFFAVILIPRYEAMGAAVAVLIGMILGNVLLLFFSKQTLKFAFPLGVALKCIGALLIVGLVSIPVLQTASDLMSLVFGAFVAPLYFVILFAFGVITKQDLRYLKTFISG
ncbi:hypothetical protein COT72_00655 [archaeon CG10_big_fil_rev_8_21_14_0_10_43_11]|nr:MAG: hypothetical protein COT72_00655 [archaeon CG10_big_fil_rev_8_21_14_0_10_43_11]